MARTRFHVPQHLVGDSAPVTRSLLTGLDRIPRAVDARWEESFLSVQLPVRESAKLSVPWRLGDDRELLLDTASLTHRDRPYILALELARGVLHRVRMPLPAAPHDNAANPRELGEQLQSLEKRFVDALSRQSDVDEVTRLSMGVIEDAARWQEAWQAVRMDTADEGWRRKIGLLIPRSVTRSDFEATRLRTSIAAVACETNSEGMTGRPSQRPCNWCPSAGMKTIVGPIIGQNEEFHDLQEAVEYVERVVQAHSGHVDMWHCWAGLNKFTRPSHGEESRLRLAATSVELLSHVDPQTDRMISFDQPFGEYLAHGTYDFGPLQFAETLVRGDLPLDQLGLELNLGVHADATPWRDPLSLHRWLDRWACLGLPLVILLTCASSMEAKSSNCQTGADADRIELLLHTLASRGEVQAVLWNAWGDRLTMCPPRHGLFEESGAPRQAMFALRRATTP